MKQKQRPALYISPERLGGSKASVSHRGDSHRDCSKPVRPFQSADLLPRETPHTPDRELMDRDIHETRRTLSWFPTSPSVVHELVSRLRQNRLPLVPNKIKNSRCAPLVLPWMVGSLLPSTPFQRCRKVNDFPQFAPSAPNAWS